MKAQEILTESGRPQEIEIIPLNFKTDDLAPVLSKDTLDLHFGKLAKGYAERYNKKEGDREFNYAGAFLHNMLFPQFQAAVNNNKPVDPILSFINRHFVSYDRMKDAFVEEAMKLQGSNWIYLASNGKIKTIHNHEVRNDIILLIDWWEHAWTLDYGSDKKKYLAEQWKVINWNVIGARLGKK